MEREREALEVVEQLGAQIVDHPLPDRNREVIVENVDQPERHVQHHQAHAGGDQQVRGRKPGGAGGPRCAQWRAAQYVVDDDLERPRLEHFQRGGEYHADQAEREAAHMRPHPAQHHADKPDRAHQAASSSTWARAPSAATASAAATLSAAGRRLKCSTASVAADTPAMAAAAIAPGREKPVASITTTIAPAAAAIRHPAGAARHESATRPSSSSSPLIRTRIPGGINISRSYA